MRNEQSSNLERWTYHISSSLILDANSSPELFRLNKIHLESSLLFQKFNSIFPDHRFIKIGLFNRALKSILTTKCDELTNISIHYDRPKRGKRMTTIILQIDISNLKVIACFVSNVESFLQ